MQCQFFNSAESIGGIENCVGEHNIQVKLLKGKKFDEIQVSLDDKRQLFDDMEKDDTD